VFVDPDDELMELDDEPEEDAEDELDELEAVVEPFCCRSA
jgi:hypothetical protein